MKDTTRTHTLGELTKQDSEKTVILNGWVHRRRDHGGIIFIDLRDRFGLTQVVFDPTHNPAIHELAESLRSEWSIAIKGQVRDRKPGMANPRLKTGEIEVLADELVIFSKAKTPPFSISDESIEVNEDLRLQYRYLDIRRGDIAKNLILRHQVMQVVRKFLDSQGFIEVTTPILGKSTPEGARDYLVPSRVHPGEFYALPQSPQIFKQLLMISGMDRYFQIASCFRDEDLRADRQPEFTQIDIEMSYGYPDLFMGIVEKMIQGIFKECGQADVSLPIKRMPHAEALERFGTDRPDLRFGMELINLTELAEKTTFSVFLEAVKNGGIIKGIVVKSGAELSRKEIDQYITFVNQLGGQGLAWMKRQEEGLQSSIVKFFSDDVQKELIEKTGLEVGDLIFMVADSRSKTNQLLDHLRRKVARDMNRIPEKLLEFVWVTDFPLFAWDDKEHRVVSEHHPFTSPVFEDIPLLDKEPLKVRSNAYDLVLNGYEIGGGSQRIHDEELQAKIFSLLQLSPDEIKNRFGFFIEALSYGTPPHLGIAFGLDRIIMLLAGTENIRDVIAFPKTQKATDIMLGSPSEVAQSQLKELNLEIEKRSVL